MRLLPRRALLASMASTMTTPTRALVVDSHLHVWSSTSAFAPGKEPPSNLGDAVASAEAFAAACQESGVDRALIVQPINYLFDHTYVSDSE
jgi:predicted TIM-barrel fold metal-dependent hydrolase